MKKLCYFKKRPRAKRPGDKTTLPTAQAVLQKQNMASDQETTKGMERRIRAVLVSSPGSKTMVDLLKDFEALFPRLPKPTLTTLKDMTSVVRVEYSDELADFLVSLIDGDDENESDEYGNHSHSEDEFDIGGGGDERERKPLTEEEMDLKADYNGTYTLCFPKMKRHYMRVQRLRDKFQPFKFDGYSITPWYVFIRFYDKEVATEVLHKFRAKMDIRPAHRRVDKETDKEGRERRPTRNRTPKRTPPKSEDNREVKENADKMTLSTKTTKVAKSETGENDNSDLKKTFERYRNGMERKVSDLQKELFTINHKLQDMAVDNLKGNMALQATISSQEDKINKLMFTVHTLQDNVQQTQSLAAESTDVDK